MDGTLKRHDDWKEIDYLVVIINSKIPQPSDAVLDWALTEMEKGRYKNPFINSCEHYYEAKEMFSHLIYIHKIAFACRCLGVYSISINNPYWQDIATKVMTESLAAK